MGFDRFIVLEFANELTAKGGLPGADITDDYIQPPAQAQRQLQLLKTTEMLPGLVKEFRIGGIGKGFSLKIEDAKVIHFFYINF